MFALLALPGDPRGFQVQVEIDLFALGLLPHLELGFVECAAAGDFAPLRLFFAADAFLGDRELMHKSRRFDRLPRGKLGFLGLLLAERPLLHQLRALHCAAKLDLALLFEPGVFGLAIDLEDLLLRPRF